MALQVAGGSPAWKKSCAEFLLEHVAQGEQARCGRHAKFPNHLLLSADANLDLHVQLMLGDEDEMSLF
jgi:hypothetical protein